MSQKCVHTPLLLFTLHVTFTYTYMYCTLYRYYCSVDIQELLHIFKNLIFFNKARFSTNIHTLCTVCSMSCTFMCTPCTTLVL